MHQTYENQVKHLLAVDCVIFGYENEALKVLLFRRKIPPVQGHWSLVGGWVHENESVETAANRVLKNISGLTDIYMEQVSVFSKPDRDPAGRVVTVGFNALLNIQEHNADLVREHGAYWWPVKELPELIFDHQEIFYEALTKLQTRARYYLIGRELLPEEFTVTQLRKLYDSIFLCELDPGNFRKKILSLDMLNRTEKKDTSESKKGAFLYRFKKGQNGQTNEKVFIV